MLTMIELKDLIKKTITELPAYSDEQLVYYYKCALSKRAPSEKTAYASLIKAIESERNKRNKTKPIQIEGDSDVGDNEKGA